MRMLPRLLWESMVPEADDLVVFPSDQRKISPWYYFPDGLMDMKSENNDSYYPWLVELPFEDGSWNTLPYCSPLKKVISSKKCVKLLKLVLFPGKRSPHMSDYNLLSYILKNADFLDMNNFSLLIELTFAVSPSTAHVERSFSFPAWGYAQ